MSESYDDYGYCEDGFVPCPHCRGFGEVNCRCGGDLCLCENYGDAPCPVCHGECEVSEERCNRYEANQRENARLMAVAWEKVEARNKDNE